MPHHGSRRAVQDGAAAVAARAVPNRPHRADVMERFLAAIDLDGLSGPDDDSVGAELLPGRPPGEAAVADGGQRSDGVRRR